LSANFPLYCIVLYCVVWISSGVTDKLLHSELCFILTKSHADDHW